jgi:hypothetical protein
VERRTIGAHRRPQSAPGSNEGRPRRFLDIWGLRIASNGVSGLVTRVGIRPTWRRPLPQITQVWADSAYTGQLVDWADDFLHITLKTVSPAQGHQRVRPLNPPSELAVVRSSLRRSRSTPTRSRSRQKSAAQQLPSTVYSSLKPGRSEAHDGLHLSLDVTGNRTDIRRCLSRPPSTLLLSFGSGYDRPVGLRGRVLWAGHPCRRRSWKKSSMTWSCPERAVWS